MDTSVSNTVLEEPLSPVAEFLTTSRLHLVDELVRELSVQNDPDQLIRSFSRYAELFIQMDGVVSVSRRGLQPDRKSTRLNSSHIQKSRMPSSA